MESLARKRRPWYLLLGVGLVALVVLGIWAAYYQPTAMPPPPPVLTGRVLSPGGQPVAGARVYLVQSPVALPDVALLTDSSGTFALAVPVPGIYQLGCTADGFAPITVAAEVVIGQPAVAEIRLR